MRRRMNYFLVCLSVADLFVLVICLPVALHEFYGKERWFIGEAMFHFIIPPSPFHHSTKSIPSFHQIYFTVPPSVFHKSTIVPALEQQVDISRVECANLTPDSLRVMGAGDAWPGVATGTRKISQQFIVLNIELRSPTFLSSLFMPA
ncbi:orexin receptor type 2-like [Plakobranchus ocellatus]|uniref:Orexin receptor type 2-like n=1 Tax=Plakobranchus ocellatus TaxID=259542 RepID=A0AAV4CW80_9GAST|nr:orexin receptor type 2-like [Plakobranchus ocellatus]